MPSSPWAQAVESMGKAMLQRPADCACSYYGICYDKVELSNVCSACQSAMLRAALPHIMRAVVEEVDDGGVCAVLRRCGYSVRDDDPFLSECAKRFRTTLLATFTNAAGRVGG